MLDKVRHGTAVEYVRRALRDKAMRVVDDVVSTHFRRQAEQIDRLRGEVADQIGRAHV